MYIFQPVPVPSYYRRLLQSARNDPPEFSSPSLEVTKPGAFLSELHRYGLSASYICKIHLEKEGLIRFGFRMQNVG